MSDAPKGQSLAKEEWREYRFPDAAGRPIVHRIESPQSLFMRLGGTTHRVLDADGIVHILPAPGHCGCALIFKPRDVSDPVQF